MNVLIVVRNPSFLILVIPAFVPLVLPSKLSFVLLLSPLLSLTLNIAMLFLLLLPSCVPFFLKHRVLLDLLFIAARNTFANLFNDRKFRKLKKQKKSSFSYPKKRKSKYLFKDDKDSVMFGAIATLHTFGRSLQWNPHIHVLLSEEGFDRLSKKLKSFSFMSYEKLRKTWMYEVLKLMEPKLGKDFYDIKQQLYLDYPDGFYVYAPPFPEDVDEDDIDEVVKYMTRYTSRPPMAESRIVEYNPTNKTIHWYYHRHEDEQRVDKYQHIHTFLNDLLLHCPEKNFKMVRYYGYYSHKNRKTLDIIYELLGQKKKRQAKKWKQRKHDSKLKMKQQMYRNQMIETFQVDPILCSCGALMTYVESYVPENGQSFSDRRYRERCLYDIRRLKQGRNS